jgi:hypothetical protein
VRRVKVSRWIRFYDEVVVEGEDGMEDGDDECHKSWSVTLVLGSKRE